jgi:microcystin-dependent protein
MADTFTTNLGLTKPQVGASTDSWGTKLNAGLDALDAVFAGAGTGTPVGINVGAGKKLRIADAPVASADAVNLAAMQAALAALVPSGVILLWSGAANAIPAGWKLCDGTNGTPDLRGRFIIGAGGSYAVGASGGNASMTLNTSHIPSHSHDFSANSTLSSNQHTHDFFATTSYAGDHQHDSSWGESPAVTGSPFGLSGRTSVAGSGGTDYDNSAWLTSVAGGHTHTFGGTTSGFSADHFHTTSGTTSTVGSGASFSLLNPFYALCYIQKA